VILKHVATMILLATLWSAKQSIGAEQIQQQLFQTGSYQKILANNKAQPFILSIWSVNCSSCLKEMQLIKKIHRDQPDLKFVLLAVDDYSAADAVQEVINKQGVEGVESWVFAEQNSQRLRYEIDPRWYGEIPRTYFFDQAHNRVGISGLITEQEYLKMIAGVNEQKSQ
jgi:hypothetical protein